jgi:hypothetical protein
MFLKHIHMDKDRSRQEAYPKPSTADKQFENQPEYIDQQPNDMEDRSISDVPGTAPRVSNDPEQEIKKDDK